MTEQGTGHQPELLDGRSALIGQVADAGALTFRRRAEVAP